MQKIEGRIWGSGIWRISLSACDGNQSPVQGIPECCCATRQLLTLCHPLAPVGWTTAPKMQKPPLGCISGVPPASQLIFKFLLWWTLTFPLVLPSHLPALSKKVALGVAANEAFLCRGTSQSTETQECTAPGVNPNVNHGRWVITMCQCRLISCNKFSECRTWTWRLSPGNLCPSVP